MAKKKKSGESVADAVPVNPHVHPSNRQRNPPSRHRSTGMTPGGAVIPHLLLNTQKGFLTAYSLTGNVRYAGELARVEHNRHYLWLQNDPAYAQAFLQAHRESDQRLEQEARRRAVEGVRKYKFHQGAPLMVPLLDELGHPVIDPDGRPVLTHYYEHVYSDNLLMFIMKGQMKKYRNLDNPVVPEDKSDAQPVRLGDFLQGLDLPPDTLRAILDAMRKKTMPVPSLPPPEDSEDVDSEESIHIENEDENSLTYKRSLSEEDVEAVSEEPQDSVTDKKINE